MRKVRLSASISDEMHSEVDAYLKKNSVSMDYLLDVALQHYFEALKGIPDDVCIPSKLLITRATLQKISNLLVENQEPSTSLKQLMRDE